MSRRHAEQQLGDKLGPRLVELVVQAVVGARRGLAPWEAHVRALGMQRVIDRAGHEVADHHRDLIQSLIDADDNQPDWLVDYLTRTASGHHQWQAISGALSLTGVTGGLGTIMTNYLAPAVQSLVGDLPLLQLDQNAAAVAVTRGVLGHDEGARFARQAGFGGEQFDYLVQLAQQQMDLGSAMQAHNRGLLPQDGLQQVLVRSGYDPRFIDVIVSLSRTILSPADAALAVLRGTMTHQQGVHIAGQNGIASYDFDTLVANTGEPLGLMQLLEAYRRGIISKARLDKGIVQSRVRTEWIDVAEALRYSPVATADAIDAWQRGHLTQAQATTIAEQNGVTPAQVPVLLANAGNPLPLEQLLELWRRGELSEAEVDKGIVQGRTRTDWTTAAKKLRYSRMTTADALDAWQRGHITQAAAVKVAEENGVTPGDVPALLANAGNPLSLEQLLEAHRRGYITAARMREGIRAGRTRNDWIETAVSLSFSPMSTAEAVEAAVQGQLPLAAAKKIANENGLREADFQPLYDTAGAPLARTELQQLFNRGLISRGVYEQGLKESRLKNKYVQTAMQLHVRLPEPRQVTMALADGVISPAQAAKLLAEDGYSKETTDMLIRLGTIRSTGPYRQLMASQVAKLYADRIMSHTAAIDHLVKLHYQPQTAEIILNLADHERDQRIRDSTLRTLQAHFVAHRTSVTEATADLIALGYPHDTVTLYINAWKIERLAVIRQLTPAQILKAVKLGLLVPREQLTQAQWEAKNHDAGHYRLTQLGYSGDDAELLLAGA
jgi:hypothetical protein